MFWIFNLILSSNLLVLLALYAFLWGAMQINFIFVLIEPITLLVFTFILFIILNLIFKLNLFKIIYKYKETFPFTAKFLNRMLRNSSHQYILLKNFMILDISFIFFNAMFFKLYDQIHGTGDISFVQNLLSSFLIFLFFGSGITLCYVSFIRKTQKYKS